MPAHTTIRQHPERTAPDSLAEILGQGLVAHIGFCQDQVPYVIPMAYHCDPAAPERIYLHGAHSSRAMQWLAAGHPLCVEICLLDGLVYSRTALFHSLNYRSAIGFGHGKRLEEPEAKAAVLEAMVAKYFPGRKAGTDYAAIPPEHLAATLLLEARINSWSAKAREGNPHGPLDAEAEAPGSAGVLDMRRDGSC